MGDRPFLNILKKTVLLKCGMRSNVPPSLSTLPSGDHLAWLPVPTAATHPADTLSPPGLLPLMPPSSSSRLPPVFHTDNRNLKQARSLAVPQPLTEGSDPFLFLHQRSPHSRSIRAHQTHIAGLHPQSSWFHRSGAGPQILHIQQVLR